VSTEGSGWNGHSWVPQPQKQQQQTPLSVPPPSTDLPKIPAHLEGTIDPMNASAKQLTTFFSEVYQYWAGQTAACQTSGDTSSSAYQWANYYSDLSSRAAHHYNHLVKNPPPPPSSSSSSFSLSTVTANTAPAPAPISQRWGAKANASNNNRATANSATATATTPMVPPKSFKDYAHRCLSQCISETQKKSMKELVEITIRNALQDGSMHKNNWDVEPLLAVYGSGSKKKEKKLVSSLSYGKSYANIVSKSISNKGPGTGGPGRSLEQQSLPSNDSYYGRASASASNKRGSDQDYLGDYDKNISTDYSYYGNSTSPGSSASAQILLSKKKNKKAKNNTSAATMASTIPLDGDFISLSSLSSARSVNVKAKKKNKKAAKKLKENANEFGSGFGFNGTASKLASRANRFSGQGGITDASSEDKLASYSQNIDRYMGKTIIGGNSKKGGVKLNDDDYEKMTVKGTCKVLEKEYLRLTAPPKANLVRPEPILKKHLINLKKLRKIQSGKSSCSSSSSGAKRKDYNWFCSQLKAIRQDLTVQRIFNEFAVQVYEFHAKTALEEGDLNEYNQSQTQLKELYEIVDDPYPTIGKGDKSKSKGLENQNEFIAYRIIYYVFMTGNKKYEGGSTDLFKIMLSLSPEQRLDSFISHALKVRIAVADNDYHAFFRLQDKAPSMAAYLMDFIVPSIRASGLKCMMKAYRPTISAEFVLIELGFVFNGKVDKKEGIAWLKGCGCKFNSDRDLIVAKDSVLVGSVVAGVKTSSLI